MIEIAPGVLFDEGEVRETFVRASGPGGQNVNKVSSAVELRLDVRGSPSLPEGLKARLASLAGRRLTREGVLVLDASRHRGQAANRADAMDRLLALLRAAAERPKPRRPTRPTLASGRRRLEGKAIRAVVKLGRGAGRGSAGSED